MASLLLLACYAGFALAPIVPVKGVHNSAYATCKTVSLEAAIDVADRKATGTWRCVVQNSGTLWLANYPQSLNTLGNVDELTALWEYPDGFSPAAMTLTSDKVHALPSPNLGVWQNFGRVQAGTTVEIKFHTTLPNRQGTLGVRGPVATLLGGWHPVLGTGPGTHPRLLSAPIAFRITVPNTTAGFIGTHPFGLTSPRCRVGRHQGTAVPALVAPRLHVHASPGAILVAAGGSHRGLASHDDITADLDEPAHAQALVTVAQGAGFLREAQVAQALLDANDGGQSAQAQAALHAPQRPTFIVITSLRDHLAEAFEGGVALSDRAFHLLPFEPLRRFHRATLWREQLRASMLDHVRATEPDWSAELVADAMGAALTTQLLEASGAMVYAPQLLDRFSMSPEVDALIFAPQIPFPEVYYNAVDESTRASHRFDTLLAPLPRGKILFEKLSDRIGHKQAVALLLAGLAPHPLPFIERVRLSYGTTVAEALTLWLGPYPKLDYALGRIHSQPHTTCVEVDLLGDDAGAVVEPITVALTDRKGQRHTATRMGPGPLEFNVPGPPKVVELDPLSRLVELHHPQGLQARINNRRPERYRLLLNDLSATLDVTGAAVALAADVVVRRLYDLRYDAHLGAFFGPYSFGSQAVGTYHFGRELTALKLAHMASITVTAQRLRANKREALRGGRQITLGGNYRYDTRMSRITASQGTGIDAGITLGFTHMDHIRGAQPWMQLGMSWLKLWPVQKNQSLVLRLRADTIIGQAPAQAQLRLGGRYLGARGYQINEARGPHRALVSAEYRHALVGDSRTDIFGMMTLTRVEGAIFGDGVYMPKRQPVCGASILSDVGYGVRFMGDILGVSPATLAVDVALPFGRCKQSADKLPITIYVAFVQSFFAF